MINEIRGKHKVKIKPSFIIDGNVIERRVIANGFNKYFKSIASKLNECDNGLSPYYLTHSELYRLCQELC